MEPKSEAQPKPRPPRVLRLETTWIREYARTYLPSEAGFSYSAAHVRQVGLDLVKIRNILRSGYVVRADKLDDPGALWVVEGDDNDGNTFRLTLTVISETLAVSLMKAERTQVVEDGDDAA